MGASGHGASWEMESDQRVHPIEMNGSSRPPNHNSQEARWHHFEFSSFVFWCLFREQSIKTFCGEQTLPGKPNCAARASLEPMFSTSSSLPPTPSQHSPQPLRAGASLPRPLLPRLRESVGTTALGRRLHWGRGGCAGGIGVSGQTCPPHPA